MPKRIGVLTRWIFFLISLQVSPLRLAATRYVTVKATTREMDDVP